MTLARVPARLDPRVLHVLCLSGGEPVTLQMEAPQAPPLSFSHAGGDRLTVWSIPLTAEEVREVVCVLEGSGVRVRVAHEEQPLRPLVECARCVWQDIEAEGVCGLVTWDAEQVAEWGAEQEGAGEDARRCPRFR